MEVETTTGVMLSLHRYNEAVRLLERYVRLADSIDVGAETKRETWDWLENVYGKPWQNCEIPGCYSNRRCLVQGYDPKIYPCKTTQASGGSEHGK